KEAVDIIAFAAPDDVLFVECTLRELDSRKLDKLSARARAFEESMERRTAEERVYVRRALFMPVRRNAVPPHTALAAEEHGAMLVCAEELEEMIQMAKRAEPAHAVLSALVSAARDRSFESHPKE